MKSSDVIRILVEEFKERKNPIDAIVETRIRISEIIAVKSVKSAISEDRWKLFKRLIKSESTWLRIIQCKEGSFLVIDGEALSDAYESVERACELLLDEYEKNSEYFKSTWGRDQLVDIACSFSTEREKVVYEFTNEDMTAFSKNRADSFLDIIHWMQLGLAGDEPMNKFIEEINVALRLIATIA